MIPFTNITLKDVNKNTQTFIVVDCGPFLRGDVKQTPAKGR